MSQNKRVKRDHSNEPKVYSNPTMCNRASCLMEIARLNQLLANMEAKMEQLQASQVPTMEWWISRRDRRRQLVTQLPDLVLKALFRQMTPADQMTASAVCSRWSGLVHEVTRLRRFLAIILDRTNSSHTSLADAEETFNRLNYGENWPFLQSLSKADGKPMYPELRSLTKWNSLQLDKLTEDIIGTISVHFSGIGQVQLFCRQWQPKILPFRHKYCNDCDRLDPQYDHLPGLLKLFSSVTTLHLAVYEIAPDLLDYDGEDFDGYNSDGPLETLPDELVTAINRLPSLKHLAIKLDGFSLPDLPIISRLEEFNCWPEEGEEDAFLKQIFRYGQVKPTRIGYVGDLKYKVAFLSEDMRARFVRFDGYQLDLPTVSKHFPSLTSLKLTEFTNPGINVYDFFRFLSQLNQLEFLNLHDCLKNIHPDDQNRLLEQIKSLKILRLFRTINSHRALDLLNIPWTMPNIEVLQVDYTNISKCTDCGVWFIFKPKATKEACIRQLTAPLEANCPKLRIFRMCEGYIDSVDQTLVSA